MIQSVSTVMSAGPFACEGDGLKTGLDCMVWISQQMKAFPARGRQGLQVYRVYAQVFCDLWVRATNKIRAP